MSRQCDQCSMCCKLLAIVALNKPPCVWCYHCSPGRERCTIYEDRPEECKVFKCLWMQDENWPEELRPDKSHVVLRSTNDGMRIIANVDPGYPEAYNQGLMGKLLNKLSLKVDVIVVLDNKRKLLTTVGRREALEQFMKEEQCTLFKVLSSD